MQSNEIWDRALLAVGEDEGGRAYFLIAVLIISAIHWLWQRLKEKREEEQQVNQTPLETSRTDTWESEDEWDTTNAPAPLPVGSELKRFFESLSGTPPPPPVLPPPRAPAARKSQTQAKAQASPTSALTPKEKLALKALKSGSSTFTRTRRQRIHASSEHTALAKMLRDPVGMRNAFILKEILDPPVSAREDPFPHSM